MQVHKKRLQQYLCAVLAGVLLVAQVAVQARDVRLADGTDVPVTVYAVRGDALLL